MKPNVCLNAIHSLKPTETVLILCMSCASYSDAWFPFGTFFHRFWPDCPYDRVLISDRPDSRHETDAKFVDANPPGIPGFQSGWLSRDMGFNMNLWTVLGKATEETVAFFQEDFFLSSKVPTKTVKRLDDWMQTCEYDCCRLFPCPGANDPIEIVPGVGLITPMAPYRASCQVAIWKRKSLLELCKRLLSNGHSTIQSFEIHGSRMVDDFKICGWIRDKGPREEWPLLYLCSAITAGKWMSGAIQFCKEQGVPIVGDRGIWYVDGAEEAVLRAGYYEWLDACAKGKIRPKNC